MHDRDTHVHGRGTHVLDQDDHALDRNTHVLDRDTYVLNRDTHVLDWTPICLTQAPMCLTEHTLVAMLANMLGPQLGLLVDTVSSNACISPLASSTLTGTSLLRLIRSSAWSCSTQAETPRMPKRNAQYCKIELSANGMVALQDFGLSKNVEADQIISMELTSPRRGTSDAQSESPVLLSCTVSRGNGDVAGLSAEQDC